MQVFQAGANRLLLESPGLLVEPLGHAQSFCPQLLVAAFPVGEFLQATERNDQPERPQSDQVRGSGKNRWNDVTVTAQGTHDDLHDDDLIACGVTGVCHGGATAQVALLVVGGFPGRDMVSSGYGKPVTFWQYFLWYKRTKNGEGWGWTAFRRYGRVS